MTLPVLTPEDRARLVAMIAQWGGDPKRVAADLRAGKIRLRASGAAMTRDLAATLRNLELRLAGELDEAADARTLEDLAAAGYTHIAVRCDRCRTTRRKPIPEIPPQSRAQSLAGLAPRLRCQACGMAPSAASLAAWRASDPAVDTGKSRTSDFLPVGRSPCVPEQEPLTR